MIEVGARCNLIVSASQQADTVGLSVSRGTATHSIATDGALRTLDLVLAGLAEADAVKTHSVDEDLLLVAA